MSGDRAGAMAPASSLLRALFADLAHGGDLLPAAPGPHAARRQIFQGAAGSREQGTQVRVQLRIDTSAGTVLEMRYRAFGCPYTLAACEWLARAMRGRPLGRFSGTDLAEALGTAADWSERLGVPPARLGRLLVIEDALLAALECAAGEVASPNP